MCGRFVQSIEQADWEALLAAQEVQASPVPSRRFNVSPTQGIAGLRAASDAAGASVSDFRFGLRGHRDHLVINARAETLAERPMFRGLLAKGRVLVAASAFYEWAQPRAPGERKVPCCFAKDDGRPFWFAALARSDGDETGCVLVTTAANEIVVPIHPRMPVMLEDKEARTWLQASTAVEDAMQVLVPYEKPMRAWAVAPEVNNPRHETSSCIVPAGEVPT